MKRQQLHKISSGGSYFAAPTHNHSFIDTGSTMLNLAMSGGVCEGRICNIIGDRSTGKTLLCIETMTNFARKHSDGRILYREAEAAFDPEYAEALGTPVNRIELDTQLDTVEDWFEDLSDVCDKANEPTLYIVDSFDALSDRAEMSRKIDEGTYGANKPKQASELFRRLVRKVERSTTTLLVVSQTRARIGASFGRMWTRSGGKALDFYCSQIVYLAQQPKLPSYLNRTVFGQRRKAGISINALVDKNKVGIAHRDAKFNIVFGFGIDDLRSCVEFLRDTKKLEMAELSESELKGYFVEVNNMPNEEYDEELTAVRRAVETVWYEMEERVLPKRRKYR